MNMVLFMFTCIFVLFSGPIITFYILSVENVGEYQPKLSYKQCFQLAFMYTERTDLYSHWPGKVLRATRLVAGHEFRVTP